MLDPDEQVFVFIWSNFNHMQPSDYGKAGDHFARGAQDQDVTELSDYMKKEAYGFQFVAEDLGVDGALVCLGGNSETFRYPKQKGRNFQLALRKLVKHMKRADRTSVDTGEALYADMDTTDDTLAGKDEWHLLSTKRNVDKLGEYIAKTV